MTWNKKKDIFALMVGHGKSLDGSWDPGCTYNKYTEAGLMLDIVKVAVKWLRKSGVKVISDSDDGNNRNMKASVAWANSDKAKCYVSVHCDYRDARSGVMYYYGSAKGKRLGDKVGKSVAKSMGLKFNGGTKDTKKFEVNSTKMTAIILETGAIKKDLAKLKDYKKYGKALAKAICKYIGVPIYVPTRIKLMRKTAALVAYMNLHHFTYDHAYKHCGMSWAQVKKSKKCNCHLLVNCAAQQIGLLKPGQIFWINGTKVVCKGKGAKTAVKKNFTIKHPKKSPAKSGLKKGYVCGYSSSAHTQEYAGQSKAKKPIWYSWGRSDVGDKQPKRKPSYDTKKIMTVLIPR